MFSSLKESGSEWVRISVVCKVIFTLLLFFPRLFSCPRTASDLALSPNGWIQSRTVWKFTLQALAVSAGLFQLSSGIFWNSWFQFWGWAHTPFCSPMVKAESFETQQFLSHFDNVHRWRSVIVVVLGELWRWKQMSNVSERIRAFNTEHGGVMVKEAKQHNYTTFHDHYFEQHHILSNPMQDDC